MPKDYKIIGNTDYKDIADKQYVSLDGEIATKTVQALTEQNVSFSGLDFGNSVKFTVSAEDLDKFKAIAVDLSQETTSKEEKVAEPKEKPKREDIIGNTEFKSIPNKQYFTLRSSTAEKVATALDSAGIKFSGRVDGKETKLTISSEDVDKYKSVVYDTVFVDKSKEKTSQAKLNVIGNTDFKSIPDKQYASIPAEKAKSMAKVFEEKGVPFSALIKGDKATVTLSAEDMKKFRSTLSRPEAEKAEKKSIMGQLKENKEKTVQQQLKPQTQNKQRGTER